MEVFAKNLKRYRKNKNISGLELSQKLGVKYTTYMNYENRGNQPSFEVLCKIADVLEVSTDMLLGRSSSDKEPAPAPGIPYEKPAECKITFEYMNFNKRLKYFRELSGMTGKEFAEKIGVSYGSYMNYENKQNQPSFEVLYKMADVLGVSIDTLLGHDVSKYQKWINMLEKSRTPIIFEESPNNDELTIIFPKDGEFEEMCIKLTKEKFIEIMETSENVTLELVKFNEHLCKQAYLFFLRLTYQPITNVAENAKKAMEVYRKALQDLESIEAPAQEK